MSKTFLSYRQLSALAVASLLAAGTSAAQPATPQEMVRAKVVKVDAVHGTILLKHERIKSIDMDAMTMPFKAKDRSQLKPLKAGDQVRFSVVMDDGEPMVNVIQRTAPARAVKK